ncbi:MAG: type III-A CRISPR-associated protein Csm2 [Chloroflexi bacterium]|nr:MAG: type III-A CRISPR-associated protein Csm2 [Chloroflexota bacterium]
MALPSQQDLQRIIQEGDADLLVKVALELGKGLARQLTTSQIRNIFGTVRQIEMSWSPQADEEEQKWAARQLMLLKPKLAYQAKRERGRGVTMLAEVLTPAIDMVGNDREKFQNFVDFFEAILAYHTAHSGF